MKVRSCIGSGATFSRGLSVVSGLLVTAACGANDPFTDLFPNYGDAGPDAAVDASTADAEAPSSAPVDGGSSGSTTSAEASVSNGDTSTSGEQTDAGAPSVTTADETTASSDEVTAVSSSGIATETSSTVDDTTQIVDTSNDVSTDIVVADTSSVETGQLTSADVSADTSADVPADTSAEVDTSEAELTEANTTDTNTAGVGTSEETGAAPTSADSETTIETANSGVSTADEVTVIVVDDTTEAPETTEAPVVITDVDFTLGELDAGADAGADAGEGDAGGAILDASVTEEPGDTEGELTVAPPDESTTTITSTQPVDTSVPATTVDDTSIASSETTEIAASTDPGATSEPGVDSEADITSEPATTADSSSEFVTSEAAETSAVAETSEAADIGTTDAAESTEEPIAECGNGVLEDGELCCTEAVVTSELDTRSLATEAALETATTCAPTQSGATDSGFPRVTYSFCTGTCEDGNTGCDTVLDNTSVIYDPATRTVTGFADVTLMGALNWANVFGSGSCSAVVSLPGVEFTANVGWTDDPQQVVVTLTNLDVDVETASVSGCTPARPATRSLADIDLAAMVAPAITSGLTDEFAGALACPY